MIREESDRAAKGRHRRGRVHRHPEAAAHARIAPVEASPRTAHPSAVCELKLEELRPLREVLLAN